MSFDQSTTFSFNQGLFFITHLLCVVKLDGAPLKASWQGQGLLLDLVGCFVVFNSTFFLSRLFDILRHRLSGPELVSVGLARGDGVSSSHSLRHSDGTHVLGPAGFCAVAADPVCFLKSCRLACWRI